jgi:acetyl-CoA carboxylase/biotin carboxylase 1
MFGNAREIAIVAMATPEDLAANADYIRRADTFVEVPGGPNKFNYANVNLIVDIAVQTKVDAVWAGWGHASEDPRLPDALALAPGDIRFIGPSGNAMRALGDKIASTIVAQARASSVPCLPWNGSHIILEDELKRIAARDAAAKNNNNNNNNSEGAPSPSPGTATAPATSSTATSTTATPAAASDKPAARATGSRVPPEVFRMATLETVEEALSKAAEIGYPVMLKASEGGGGKGIRKVNNEEEMKVAFRMVRSEVPSSPIFCMKLAPESRHLEVQLLADNYGNCISLFGRDCSVQRRHQKIIEEGPVTVAPQHLLHAMEDAAIRLAKEVDYSCAGTVEYLYFGGEFYFLELNPRLQVEHPVTEMITGVNLPAAQLQVTMGIPLGRIPDIRRLYGYDPYDAAPIDFATAPRPSPKGHVVAVRITAENPDQGFKPTSGSIQELSFNSTPNVWGYFSVGNAGGGLHEFADSQFGHLFSWAETRPDALAGMVVALKEVSVRGDIRTPVEFLIQLMESEAIKKNTFHNMWLDSLIAAKVTTERPDYVIAILCAIALRAYKTFVDNQELAAEAVRRGQIPAPALFSIVYEEDVHYEGVRYPMVARMRSRNTFTVFLNGSVAEVNVRPLSDGGYLISFNSRSHVVYPTEEAFGLRLLVDGKTCSFPKEHDPSQIIALSPGKLVRFLVQDGEHIRAGQAFAEMEVMKMFMPVLSTSAGLVNFSVPEGAILRPGDVIGRLVLDDPSSVKKSVTFTDKLPPMTNYSAFNGDRSDQVLERTVCYANNLFIGFSHDVHGTKTFDKHVEHLISTIEGALRDPNLPRLQLANSLSAVAAHLTSGVRESLSELLEGEASPALGLAHAPVIADSASSAGSTGVSASSDNEDAPTREDAEAVADVQALGSSVVACLDAHIKTLRLHGTPEDTVKSFVERVQGLRDVAEVYRERGRADVQRVFAGLIDSYLEVEEDFGASARLEDAFRSLRERNSKAVGAVVVKLLSHNSLHRKNMLLIALLNSMGRRFPDCIVSLRDRLQRLAKMRSRDHASVALRARQLISQLPDFRRRLAVVISSLRQGGARVKELIDQTVAAEDVLAHCLYHQDVALRASAAEVWVRRAYCAYETFDVSASGSAVEPVGTTTSACKVTWSFAPSAKTDDQSLMMSFGSSGMGGVSTANLLAAASSSSSSSSSSASPAGVGAVGRHLRRPALLLAYANVEAIAAGLESVFEECKAAFAGFEAWGTLYLAFLCPSASDSAGQPLETAWSHIEALVHGPGMPSLLRGARVSRLTVMAVRHQDFPIFRTFRERAEYAEDVLTRDFDPPLAFQLQLHMMSDFTLRAFPVGSPHIRIFLGESRHGKARGPVDRRYFVRIVVRQGVHFNQLSATEYVRFEGERLFVEALDALEMALADPKFGPSENNQVFLNFLPTVELKPDDISELMRKIVSDHGRRIWDLHVRSAEMSLACRHEPIHPGGSSKPAVTSTRLRFTGNSTSQFSLHLNAYREIRAAPSERRDSHYEGDDDQQQQQQQQQQQKTRTTTTTPSSSSSSVGEEMYKLPTYDVSGTYPATSDLDLRRFMAQGYETVYVYDIPDLMARTLQAEWGRAGGYMAPAPAALSLSKVLECVELALSPSGDSLVECPGREPCHNTCGMVAWRMTARTPEYPEGRPLVVIANDITFRSGSFAVEEDVLFDLASKLARAEGVPRLYFSCNSGARLSLAQEVQEAFRVQWINQINPLRGFRNLYLSDEDAAALGEAVAVTHPESPGVNVISTIIGRENGIGVENLRASGTIAGETSVAYRETFTLTLVTGRSVGIGAYLVRLGQRTIQCAGSPIILTGAPAINKVLGHQVYESNLQLGGPAIMGPNGVSHLITPDLKESVVQAWRWLAYVPERRSASPLSSRALSCPADPVDRDVAFHPPQATPYDPRCLIAGAGPSQLGLFDRDSFVETLSDWAKSVVVGRARLGGLAVGVIAAEIRATEHVHLADPAVPTSTEEVRVNAGQVWYPASAFKTAESIRDIHQEGLPIIILASWRGFSGGMRDMSEEVLKFGSHIVDALTGCTRPVFVYLPPHSELRGGAWVVLDPSINSNGAMEMFADPTARAGILEPAGIVEIKFRRPALVATMMRLDDRLKELSALLKNPACEDKAGVKAQIDARIELLLPVYGQVAETFAGLHDTPGRMKAKATIDDIVPFAQARRYFYWRLMRRLREDDLAAPLRQAGASWLEARAAVRALATAATATAPAEHQLHHPDMRQATWLAENEPKVRAKIADEIKARKIARIRELAKELGEADLKDLLK